MRAEEKTDRITELGIKGVRTLADLRLKLGALTTIIGANGVGKSSIVEACVLLYRVAHENFARAFLGPHGGFPALLRRGEQAIELSVRVEGAGPPLEYAIVLTRADPMGGLLIQSELLEIELPGLGGARAPIFQRSFSEARIASGVDGLLSSKVQVQVDAPLFSLLGMQTGTAIGRLRAALSGIVSQIGFPTTPLWAATSLGVTRSLRETVVAQPAERLEFGGLNLANAFHALQNEKPSSHWAETMEYVRLGLGQDIDRIVVQFDPGGGRASLALRRNGDDRAEPAWVLSDGQLIYLAFVAMFRLESPASLIVFDEPDLHLHPALIQRVLGFFDQMSERTTVILTTHSDRLLDALPDPANSTLLLELNEKRACEALRPSAPQLSQWLAKYNGIGSLRAQGYEALLFADSASAVPPKASGT
jgi:predicted ATPase